MSDRTVQILLVDDDETDAEQVMRSFAKLKIANPITHVSDGNEALQTRRGEGGHKCLSRPYLILLDINMPRLNGLEFLKALRNDEELQQSIVFIVTTSDREEDKVAAYDKHVAGYFLKSRIGHDFLALPLLMKNFWKVVQFPPSQ